MTNTEPTDAASPGQSHEQRMRELPEAGKLGMTLFLMSLSVLFAASLVGYLVVRFRAENWPPAGAPELPGGLWVVTLILIVASLSIHRAVHAARSDRAGQVIVMVVATLLLGLAFTAVQAFNWQTLYQRMTAQPLPNEAKLYPFTFYLLTSLHALHVIGGLIALAIVLRHALKRRYSAADHAGLRHCAVYWHFLDATWIVIFIVLMSAG